MFTFRVIKRKFLSITQISFQFVYITLFKAFLTYMRTLVICIKMFEFVSLEVRRHSSNLGVQATIFHLQNLFNFKKLRNLLTVTKDTTLKVIN